MARRVARDVEAIGLRKCLRVAVGGADADGNHRALWHEDAAERGFLCGDPVAELV